MPSPPDPTPGTPALLTLRVVLVRLRLLAVPLAAFAVVVSWPLLRNYWDRLTTGKPAGAEAVSVDTEYFCPMCPGVLADWPTRCPVCNMTLVRRKRGEAVPLPDGVVARMQLSPYRVQLAGIQTTPVGYRPLAREVTVVGIAEREAVDRKQVLVEAEVFEKDLGYLAEGRAAEATCEACPGRTFTGKVRDVQVRRVRLEVEDPQQELRPGLLVTARVRAPVQEMEPFRARGTADGVLAVPESAVVDTGTRKVVYVERMPGMFDGVEVVLGPRCGDWFPVASGLEVGQKVATTGAFLLDAEAKLNPSLAASYFGAGKTPESAPPPPDMSKVAKTLAKLSPADRALAERQKVCPVTGEPLGSMGTPPAVVVEGKTVFLCCKGCEGALRKNPEKYLPKLGVK
jgi:Barrel-sandwich domain of CusB or HlyD membrane-fusion/Heavy metal binding domain